MIIKYSPSFLKIFKKVDVRIRKNFKQRILVFSKNPNELELNNHPLEEEWEGHRSVDVTADYRAVFKEEALGENTVAHFVTLGTHNKLYKKKN